MVIADSQSASLVPAVCKQEHGLISTTHLCIRPTHAVRGKVCVSNGYLKLLPESKLWAKQVPQGIFLLTVTLTRNISICPVTRWRTGRVRLWRDRGRSCETFCLYFVLQNVEGLASAAVGNQRDRQWIHWDDTKRSWHCNNFRTGSPANFGEHTACCHYVSASKDQLHSGYDSKIHEYNFEHMEIRTLEHIGTACSIAFN